MISGNVSSACINIIIIKIQANYIVSCAIADAILPCSDACKSTWGMLVIASRANFLGRIDWCIFGYVNFLYKRTLERKLPGNAIELLIDSYDFQIFSKARKF